MSEIKIDPAQGLAALSEATTDSLTELFNRNPLEMDNDHLSRIVEEYRKMRARWQTAEAAGKKSLPKVASQKSLPTPSAPTPPKDMEF